MPTEEWEFAVNCAKLGKRVVFELVNLNFVDHAIRPESPILFEVNLFRLTNLQVSFEGITSFFGFKADVFGGAGTQGRIKIFTAPDTSAWVRIRGTKYEVLHGDDLDLPVNIPHESAFILGEPTITSGERAENREINNPVSG